MSAAGAKTGQVHLRPYRIMDLQPERSLKVRYGFPARRATILAPARLGGDWTGMERPGPDIAVGALFVEAGKPNDATRQLSAEFRFHQFGVRRIASE